MSHSKSTTNYNLPIFVNNDQPTWLGDFNGAMGTIDTEMGKIGASASAAVSSANNAVLRVDKAESTATAANAQATKALNLANSNKANVQAMQPIVTPLGRKMKQGALNVLCVGDSYMKNSSVAARSIPNGMAALRPNWQIYNYAINGTYLKPSANNFLAQLQTAAASTSFANDDIDVVVIGGGRNDAGGASGAGNPIDDTAEIEAAYQTCVYAQTTFKNAQVIFVPCMFDWKAVTFNLKRVYQDICLGVAKSGAACIKGAYTWGTGMKSFYVSEDDIHPTDVTAKLFAGRIISAIENGEYDQWWNRVATFEQMDTVGIYYINGVWTVQGVSGAQVAPGKEYSGLDRWVIDSGIFTNGKWHYTYVPCVFLEATPTNALTRDNNMGTVGMSNTGTIWLSSAPSGVTAAQFQINAAFGC
mgnify:CR=1 FL=1|nr:MAG TPA: Esterase TesA [Caudoviricetes sp.]